MSQKDSTSNEKVDVAKAWPWVDGEDRSEKEPLPLVCPEDDRPAVRDLIEKHRIKIDKVRDNLKGDALYEPAKHDNLWILRFILSQKTVKKATAAAKATLVYRKTNGFDERDIRKDWPGSECSHEGTRKYFDCIKEGTLVFARPHPQRGVMLLLVMKDLDQHRLVKELTREEWPLKSNAEWIFQTLDSTTRQTGRLTKSIRVIDMTGFSFSCINRECLDRDSKAVKSFEDFYPQVTHTVFLLNAPTVFYAIFKMFSPILPRRFVEKFNVLNPSKSRRDLESILKDISEDHFPERYGGKHPGWPYPKRIET